jgi:hypothetical protein
VLFDEPARLQDVLCSISVCEKAEVSNAGEARRENMEKESTKELVGGQGHDASSIAAGVVLPGESDAVVVEGEDPTVGYSDAVSITGEVLEDLGRPTEGGLCVNEPFLVTWGFEPSLPGLGMLELGEMAVELELLLLVGEKQHREKLSAEQSAQQAYGEEKSVATTHPAFTIGTDPAGRDDAVQVRMGEKVLSPGVQDGKAADPGAEMLWISGDGQKGFRSGPKQQGVDRAAILERQWSQFVREGENDVEVLDVEKLLLTGLKPRGTSRALTFRTMPVTAGVVDTDDVPTLVALFRVTTEDGRPALHEVRQNATLLS